MNVKCTNIAVMLGVLALAASILTPAVANEESPTVSDDIATIDEFVSQLRNWYASDYNGFKTSYDKAVANVQPIPPDTDPSVMYDWKNKGIDDLCEFFVSWYNWLPEEDTGLEYIQKFSWIYYRNDAGVEFVTRGPGLTMTTEFVKLRGNYMDSEESLPLVRVWEEQLGSTMDQFIVPSGGFKSFNDFFIRQVKPGARPIDYPNDDSVVVAPADCIINMIVEDITAETEIPVKTQFLNINELLDNSKYAKYFVNGTVVSCILMPNTYHRYHAPVSGEVVESKEDVAGVYFGIKDLPNFFSRGNVGYGYDYSVFEHFNRGYFVIKTKDYGYVGMIPVGLNTISSVVFTEKYRNVNDTEPVQVSKGDELGYFKYGGSLNILLFEEGRFPSLNLLQGQRIGSLNKKDK
jgi:phosphatidylserine decarboxylase